MAQLTSKQRFAKRLRRARWLMCAEKDREIEYQEVAEAAHVDATTAGRWFDGDSMPRDDAMERLAEFFGVAPGWLRYGDEPQDALPAAKLTESKVELNQAHARPKRRSR